MQGSPESAFTILAIDSDTALLQFTRQLLLSNGYKVVTAPDGDTGLRILSGSKVDLILLGITMPERDGFVALKAIREYSFIPIIMVTAEKDVKMLDQALIFGADDYVTKPFKPDELLARIHAKLRRH
jgi:DNA-binding response OmpR family regulator